MSFNEYLIELVDKIRKKVIKFQKGLDKNRTMIYIRYEGGKKIKSKKTLTRIRK